MKKILILMILLLTGCSLTSILIKTDYDKVKDMMEAKESFILYIGSTNCSHCKIFKPVLEKVVKDYELEVYYIDVYNYTDSDLEELEDLTKFPKSTPTVLFIKDGVTDWQSGYNMINGSKDYEFVVEKFRANGYIE